MSAQPRRKIRWDQTLDQSAFTAFLRATTGKTRPLWETSIITFATAEFRPHALENVDYRTPESYPTILSAFNARAQNASPGGIGAGNSKTHSGAMRAHRRYEGS